MRAAVPPADLAVLLEHIECTPGVARVRALRPSFEAATPDMIASVLREAARYADGTLAPLNAEMDRHGCVIEGGRVIVKAPSHPQAWEEWKELGWPRLPHDEALGGTGLPLSVMLAVQELFDRANPAFGMLPVLQRTAARLIGAFGSDEQKAVWLEGLVDGSLAATICVSEPSVGSDVSQLRTRARETEEGWVVNGGKMWISFGDHQLCDRIIHCVLANTAAPGEPPEFSIILVEGGGAQPGAVEVTRIEEKMGLHGSPTCELRFEDARGTLLGARGRGLAQMFVMITSMRLAVAVGGLAVTSAAADTALSYAGQRRQGGPPHQPLLIIEHADIQRQLMTMIAKTHVLRGLCFAAGNLADLAEAEPEEADRALAADQLAWLLPIAKTFGAECGFDSASGAIQVLGGAGYTAEWPVEQMLRDSRIHAIFEGTSGIQALDLVHRRVLRTQSFEAFAALARAVENGGGLSDCLDLLEDAVSFLRGLEPKSPVVGRVAMDFLQLAILGATGWIAAGLLARPAASPAAESMHAAARFWLADLAERARLHHARIRSGLPEIAEIDVVRRNSDLIDA